MMKFLENLPKPVTFIIGFALVAGIGIVDCITGDYSLLMFYAVPVFFVSWFGGRWMGIGTCLAAGCARFVSNIPLHGFLLVNYWNSLEDTLFFIVISLLVFELHKALE